MKIALLSHIRFPIAMPFKGGMEAHSWQLAKGLKARGHTVHVYATGDSDPSLNVRPIREWHYERDFSWTEHGGSEFYLRLEREIYEGAMRLIGSEGYDVVHNNCLHPYPIDHARAHRLPMLTSLHVPPFEPLAKTVAAAREPWMAFTATSRFHAAQWHLQNPEKSAVHNGIDLTGWPVCETGNGRAVWAGRIVDYKGTHLAVRAAITAGIGLDIYGPVEYQWYFDDMVKPLLIDNIRYRGLVDSDAMRRALAEASVLLFTPMWDEPFGLVAIEALAGGTPIAAFDNGAVREVAGPCGVFVNPGDVEALAAAIPKALVLPRTACAAYARQHYDIAGMIERYEAGYAAVCRYAA